MTTMTGHARVLGRPANGVRFFGVAAIIINVVRILGGLTVAADFCFEQEKAHLIGNRDVASFGVVGVKPDYTDFFNMAPKVLRSANQTQIKKTIQPLNAPYRLALVCTRKIRK